MKYLRTTAVLMFSPALSVGAAEMITYVDDVRPIMQQSCFNCHNADKAKGGLDLTSYSALMRGGSVGEIVVSQDVAGSSLHGVMAHTLEPKMPPKGDKVGDDQLAVIRKWIEQGLRETADSTVKKPTRPKVDLSVGKAAVGRPEGAPPMPIDLPMGPIHHTTRPGAIPDIAGHPWSPVAAVAGQRQVLMYQTQTGELLGVLPFDYGQPQSLRFSWTGRLLMVGGGVGGQSGTVVLYDIESGRQLARVGDEVDAVLAADLDPSQRVVALGGPSKLVKAYDVASGELLYKLDNHTEWVTAIAFSPDGKYLASGDRNGGLRIWEADSGLPVYNLEGHRDSVTALAWRFDGKVLASAGDDGQAKLWEMEDGKQVKAWNAHDGGAMSIAFAEDGRLVTTGRDQRIKVWDSNGGRKYEVKPFEGLGLSAVFDTTGQVVIAGDLYGNLVRWSLADKAQQIDPLVSNPPTIAIALKQSAERMASTAEVLNQAQSLAADHSVALQKAEQGLASAEQGLKDQRSAVKAGEKRVPALEKERNQAKQRRDEANRAARDAQNKLKSVQGALRGKEGEAGRSRKNYEAASRELQRVGEELRHVSEQAEQAKTQADDQPDDQGVQKKAQELVRKVEQMQSRVQQKAGEMDKRAEQLAVAEQKVDQAKEQVKARTAEADRAEQMAQARVREYAEAIKAYDQSRKDLDAARRGVRPAEDRIKGAAANLDKAKQTTAATQQKLVAAQAVVKQAEREQVKWRSAGLRLEIDALRDRLAQARAGEQAGAGSGEAGDAIQKKLGEAQVRYRDMRAKAGLGVVE